MTAESMKKLTIRLPDDLHERLAAMARKNQRSINREVVWRIEQAVDLEFTHNSTHGYPHAVETADSKKDAFQRPDAGAGEET